MHIDTLYDYYLQCRSVSIDSRTISEGALFVALKGSRIDGNQMASQALESGAMYALVDDPDVVMDDRYVLVDDCLSALQLLARHHRDQHDIPVLAITGSNGKTTTKELIRDVLATQMKVACTLGNLNNHIGVPLTILNAEVGADIWILEMGSNAPGNIQELCHIGNPNHGLITNIGLAHLEQLGDQKGIYKEKTALFQHVIRSTGYIFLNQDDSWLQNYIDQYNRTIVFGADGTTSCKMIRRDTASGSVQLTIHQLERTYELDSNLVGEYNLYNISAAICVGHFFGITMANTLHAISHYVPTNMRSQLLVTERNQLVLDAYNANPSSMEASILSHKSIYGSSSVYILGDMLELGVDAAKYHKAIIRLGALQDVRVLTVGAIFGSCRNVNQDHFPTVEDMIDAGVLSRLTASNILIKGSRGIHLERIVPYL